MDGNAQNNFLLEEYKHMTESFLRNEELGERRVNFFLTLTGAVVGGLGLINEVKDPIDIRAVYFGLVTLFLFGIATMLRVARRNLITDEYLNAISRIRRYFVKDSDFIEYVYFPQTDTKIRKKVFSTGGLILLVSVMNAVIVTAFFMISSESLEWCRLFPSSLLILFATLFAQLYAIKIYYKSEEKKREEKGMGTRFRDPLVAVKEKTHE